VLENLPLTTGEAVLQNHVQFWAPQHKRSGELPWRMRPNDTKMGRHLNSQAFPSMRKDLGRAGTVQPAEEMADGASHQCI